MSHFSAIISAPRNWLTSWVAVARHPALGTGERIGEAELGSATVMARADRDHGHVLHAAGDDQVLRAAHDALGGEVHGLLRRTALAVDRDAGHVLGQAGGQPAGAGDVAGLGPIVSTHPKTTSSTAPGSMPVRSISALSEWAPRSAGCIGQRPLPDAPPGCGPRRRCRPQPW
jgi:hypothetical protein